MKAKTKNINIKSKGVTYNPELDKLQTKVLFKEEVALAKKLLKTTVLPKGI